MTLEELKKLIAGDEGETPVCDSNPRNPRIAHVLYLCKLQRLTDAWFCICQGQAAISG